MVEELRVCLHSVSFCGTAQVSGFFSRVYGAFEVAPVQLCCVKGVCCSERLKLWDLRIRESNNILWSAIRLSATVLTPVTGYMEMSIGDVLV